MLRDLPPDAAILGTEIFGPVAPVVRFSDEDEAIRWANDTEYGLVSYLYTGDLRRALRVSEALETGMVGVNRGIVSDPAAPFGGVKQSGLGREGGHDGLLEFTETKYIARRLVKCPVATGPGSHRRDELSRRWTDEYSGWRTSTGSRARSAGSRKLSPDEVARYLFRRVVSWGRSSNVFLRNGARLYLDVGSHPEYATPECDNISDLVVHDKAGERILEGLLVDADRRLREEGIAGDIYLFKNNTDSAGNSYGCHENYLVGRHGEFGRLADILIPFLVTRQVICGAGKVLQTPRGAVYCVSQRAEHIWEGVSSATTRSRPIINTRDEPHADAERFRRLHVIVGDSNMSETTTLLKVGCHRPGAAHDRGGHGHARPDAGEPDQGDQGCQPRHDRAAAGAARQRPGGLRAGHPARVLLQGARFHRPARRGRDHQAGAGPVGPDADAVESGNLDHVAREIDWVTKFQLIERYRAKHDLPLSSARVAQLDLAYHDVHRGRGLYYLLQRRGAVERAARDIDIFEAKSVPPQTTRARLRGEFIRRAQERRRDFTVDWVHLKLNDQAQRTVLCKDPFRSVDERVEKLIAGM